MMDNNLIHKPRTAGVSKMLLKMKQVRKIMLGQLLGSSFIFTLALGRVYWHLLLYFYRNIPLLAFVISV